MAGSLAPGVGPRHRSLRGRLARSGRRNVRSCEGGDGHCYTEPTIRFAGGREEGFRALVVALEHRFPVDAIRRYWDILEGEPRGPNWEITFRRVSCTPCKDADPHPVPYGGALS